MGWHFRVRSCAAPPSIFISKLSLMSTLVEMQVSVGPHMPTSPSSRHGSKHERAFTDDSIDDRVGNILPNRIDHNHDHTSCAKVAMQLVYAGDVAAFERYMSQLSRSQVDEVYSIKNSIGHEDGGPSVAVIAVKRGDLKLIESVLKWIPKEKVRGLYTISEEPLSRKNGRTANGELVSHRGFCSAALVCCLL